MILQTWGNVLIASLQQAGTTVLSFLPQFFGAIIIFLIGWAIASALGALVGQIVRALRVDQFLTTLELNKTIEKAGWKLDAGGFVGALVKWFLIVVFLLAASNVLGLSQVSDFLRDVLNYLPNVVVAALILIIAAFVADVVERLLRGSVQAMGASGALVGTVARWSIWIFAIFAVLIQLGIAVALVQTLVTGFVAAVAIAGGLAFGLGGREAAGDIIRKVRDDFSK